jgi:hypothetical protein
MGKKRGRVARLHTSNSDTSRPRPKLIKVSDEMQRFSVLLLEEVQTWPDVTTRPMFGLVSAFRRRKIFAALPRTRAMDAANSFIFKLHSPSASIVQRARKDERVRLGEGKQGWNWYYLNSEQDIRGALAWLDHAWRLAK